MRILLTGGTGFIGSHFLNLALAEGHSVLALRRTPGSIPRIPLIAKPQWLDRQLDAVTVDDIKGCDVLVHLAAYSVQHPFDTIANSMYWNLTAVLALCEQARLANIQRFVVAGSCYEYGRSGEQYDAIPTVAPLQPTNSYAASKAAASIALSQWAEEFQLSLEILRLFHVYGEGEAESRFWPSLRRAALSGNDFPMTPGEQIRDFLPVVEVARTFLRQAAASDASSPLQRVRNVGTSQPISIRKFAEYWWNQWDAKGKLCFGALAYRSGEVMRYVAGNDLIALSGANY
jgi:nucleoside-diphosphate-sugar epimerase